MMIRKMVLAGVVLAAGLSWIPSADAAPAGDGGKAFTACMRSHGLPGFPEVTFSSEGLINLRIEGERVDVLSEKYGAALRACESLLPAHSRLPVPPSAPSAVRPDALPDLLPDALPDLLPDAPPAPTLPF
ncbi:hypothetical protein [Nonomuraea rubra]|uniref:Uncharacterized protein n=1 Tax=Nonomuraea rubra TaxID=46180 RepID=A0A7X0NQ74_9ACTN|nr:hypothetical protein [Nonomuraea rubra]MBB6547556.1 hypothetical protein [Nonomuraea rubra]